MNSGSITSWTKRVGDAIELGDALAEVETDKAVMTWDSTNDGYLAKILVEAGVRDVPVGKAVAVVCDKLADVPAFATFSVEETSSAPAQSSSPAEPGPADTAHAVPVPAGTGAKRPSPAAAAVMRLNPHIDFSAASCTGPRGVFTKADAINAVKQGVVKPVSAPKSAAVAPTTTHTPLAPSPSAPAVSGAPSSKHDVPHFYLFVDCTVDSALNVCDNAAGVQLTDLVVLAASKALQQVPDANAAWTPDATRIFSSPDIVLRIGPNNLATLENPTALRLSAVAEAREKLFQSSSQAQADSGVVVVAVEREVQAPNLPIPASRTLALGVGGVHDAVVPAANALGYKIVKRVAVSLGCDHRVVDGVLGAQYLQAFKKYLEQPGLLI